MLTHSDALWKIQSWGLILITFLCFFPALFHYLEYGFIFLLLVGIVMARLEGRPIWVRTPIDVPLLLFVSWTLLTVPFSIDPAYSFGEWRKLVPEVLVFYWAMFILQIQKNKMYHLGILCAVVTGIVFQCSYALVEFILQGGTWKHRNIRATAPYSGFQELNTYMVMAIPFLIVAIAMARTWWQRAGSYAALGLALLAQVFSYTRAGWVAMVIQAVGFGLLAKRRTILMALFVGFWASLCRHPCGVSDGVSQRDIRSPGP